MSLNIGVMSAAVTLDDSDYRNKLAGLENASSDTFKKIAQFAAGYLSLKAVSGFLGDAVKTFSDLEEETNKFNVVFQGMGKSTSQILADLRRDFGLSELAAKRMLAGTGDILTGFRFDRKTALDLSEGAAKLGADIASFSNYAGGAEGATTALTKAMLGETESAKMLGVVIRQDDEAYKSLIEQAMTTGVTIDALGKTFVVNSEQQAKAVAALAMAYQQSPNAIGDFVHSQDSIANQTRILQNNFQQLYSTIGGDLSSSYNKALKFSNELLSSYNNLSPASRHLLSNTVLLSSALALLGKTGAISGLNKIVTTLPSISSGFTKARAAATAFAGALGPIGAAMIALSATYMAYQYISERNRNILEAQVEAAQRNSHATKEMADAHMQERSEATSYMNRLQELSEYERLNNLERSEAEKLIDILTKKYGNLGISIDGVTGKLNLGADAWERMNEAQRKESIQDIGAQLRSTMSEVSAMQNALTESFASYIEKSPIGRTATVISKSISPFLQKMGFDVNDEAGIDRASMSEKGRELNDILKLKTVEEQIVAFERMRNSLTEEGKKENAKAVDEIIKKLKEQKNLQDSLNSAIESGKKKEGGTALKPSIQKAAQDSKAQRKAFESVSDLEWDIKFDIADAEEKARMLSEKIQTIFKKQSGKYRDLSAFQTADRNTMTEQELKDLQEIIKLEEQRRQIRDKSKKAFESEKSSYEKYLADIKKSADDKALEQKIKFAQESGDNSGALQIARDQLSKAQQAASNMKNQYEKAVRDAQADQIMTEEEKKRISELRIKVQSAFSDQEKWQGRVDSIESNERKQVENAKNIGAWSLAALNAMLGGTGKPEEETAKNTKEMVRLQRDILKKTGSSNSLTYD